MQLNDAKSYYQIGMFTPNSIRFIEFTKWY